MPAGFVRVILDGNPLNDFSPEVMIEQVVVTQEINQHWWCNLRCRQTEDRRFPIEDSIGKPLQIVATDEEENSVPLFSGFVLDVELEYEVHGSYTAKLSAVTKSYHMDIAARQMYYELGKNTSSDIVNDTLGRAGLALGGDPGQGAFPLPLVQWGETDFRFLIRQMDDAVQWVFPDSQNADALNIRSAFDDGPTLQWRLKGQLISFRVRGKLGSPSASGAHYNPLKGESQAYEEVKGDPEYLSGAAAMVDKVKSQSADLHKPDYIADRRGVLELSHYKVLLQKETNRALETAVVATGVSLNPAVAAGKKVTIKGLANAEGVYGVKKVTHTWTPEGYSNEFSCTVSSEYRDPERPKSNPWSGLVVGRVTDNNDPEKMGRLRVQYVWQEQGQTIWTRFMTPHAGADRGFLFIPEIGDEVLIAFEDSDPERPIVLGCLWNKPDTPPTEDFWGGEYQKNDIKRIVTKSGHRIQLVDKDGKESIVIATPNHVKIAMLESSDENGRPTLLLHSDGDIVFNAAGRIHSHGKFFSREVGIPGAAVESAKGSAQKISVADRPLASAVQAMAQVLNTAAQTGAPFCEVCMKQLAKMTGGG